MCPGPSSSARGSIYLITLVTVAAITSMVLIGISLRSASNTRSALIEHMSEENSGVLDASEYAFATIDADPIWRVSAQSGTLFSPLTLGKKNLTGTVTDATTGVLPTYDTTTYRLKLGSVQDIASTATSIDVLATQYDYLRYLKNNLPVTHYWPLNEHSNPLQALDLKGSYPGTYRVPSVAGASYTDQGGPVPVFAMTGDHVEVPWGNDFKSSDGSISLWLKLTNTNEFTTTGVLGMLYKAGGGPTINLSIWRFNAFAYISQDGSYQFGNFASTSGQKIVPNTWHHVVMTWGENGLFVYVDGVESGKNTSNTEAPGTAKASNGGEQPMHFGGGYSLYSPLSQPEVGFSGSIARIAMFNKQLKPSEVAALAAIKPDLRTYSLVKDSWVRLYNQ